MTEVPAAYADTQLVDSSAAPGMALAIELGEAISPSAIADLMLTLPVVAGANLVVLQPDVRQGALLAVKRGGATLGPFRLSADRATAAVLRIAVLGGLDPLCAVGSLASASNVVRLKVRAGTRSGEVLLSVGASPAGFDAEVRLIAGGNVDPGAQATGALKRCPRCGTLQPAQLERCEQDQALLIDVRDDPRPGGTIGTYRVLGRLGSGGMGVVLAAEHALIGRPVAIKLMKRSVAEEPSMVRRFLAEARAATRVRHPNVVEVTDYGLLFDGQPFMVMERVEGTALDTILAEGDTLEVSHALAIGREVARGLGAAHACGIVHNDLKPSNIVVLPSTEAEPAIKLIDFGAASLVGRSTLTERGDVIGTPTYMSPELARGEPADRRSDLYALGVVLYELISGCPPFDGNPVAVLRQQLFDTPPPLVSPRGVLPGAVIRLVARALAKDPAARHQTAHEMEIEIEQARAATERTGWKRWLPS